MEDPLSEKLLRGEVSSKSHLVIGVKNGKLSFDAAPGEKINSLTE